MNLETSIYLINTLDSISGFIFIGSVISTIFLFCCWLAYASAEDVDKNEKEYTKKKIKIRIIVSTVLLFLTCFIPSKETMYIMLGISSAKTVASTPEAQKALKVLNLGLDKAIDKLQESNGK